MKIDLLDFEGSLNLDLYIKWIQALERYLEIKQYSDEKTFKMVVLKLKKYAFLWYENTKGKKLRKEGLGSELDLN